jgi:hypothetical protein
MPKVHFVPKARKNYRADGIRKGDPYFWWKFNYGPKIRSKTRPKPSQLTRSEFLSTMADHEENAKSALGSIEEFEDFEAASQGIRDIAEEVKEFGQEQEEKANNMEEHFPNGCPIMELLRERATACERIAEELESAADKIADLNDEDGDLTVDEAIEEATAKLDEVTWDE